MSSKPVLPAHHDSDAEMYVQDVGSSDELQVQRMQIAQHNESERAQKNKTKNKSTYKAGLNFVKESEGNCKPPARLSQLLQFI